MKFAIFLQNYFPYGGLQRDAVRLAETASAAGDTPTLIVSTWDGPKPSDTSGQETFKIIELNCGGGSNHAKASRFASACREIINSGDYDTAISFSRVPGAPFYFCGDACFLNKFLTTKSAINRLLPRYQFFLENEKSLFSPDSGTHTFFLSQQEADCYQSHYPITKDHYSILPPWLSPPRKFDQPRSDLRQQIFNRLGLGDTDQLLLFVGSNYSLKRLDVLIRSLVDIPPHIHLAVCGKDNTAPPRKLAEELSISDRVHLMGAQDDIPSWMYAADLLVHPSRRETAGMVLVEALSYGLPVTCTQLCGYAPHVKNAGGTLLSQGCPPDEIAETVSTMLESLPQLREKALNWASNPEHFQTAEIILQSMRDSLGNQR